MPTAPIVGPTNRVTYPAYQQSNGLWCVKGVPAFARVTGADQRPDNYVVDDAALHAYAILGNQRATVGHYRAWHLGHQDWTDPSGDQPILGVLDQYAVKYDDNWGPVLHVDLCELDDATIDEMEKGRIPFISVETADGEIISAAGLRSKPPHFPFPNIYVQRMGGTQAVASPTQHQQFRLHARRGLVQQFAARVKNATGSENGVPSAGDSSTTKRTTRQQFDHARPRMDDQTDKQDDVKAQQHADDGDGNDAPPGPGAAPAAAPAQPDNGAIMQQIADGQQQMLTMLQQLLAANQQQAQQMQQPPNTMAPLAPATPTGYSRKGGAARQSAKQKADAIMSANFISRDDAAALAQKAATDAVQQFARQQQSREQLGQYEREIEAAGGTEADIAMVREIAKTGNVKLVQQFAANVRNRMPDPERADLATVVNIDEAKAKTALTDHDGKPYQGADKQAAVQAFTRYQKLSNQDDLDERKTFRVWNPDPVKFVRHQVAQDRAKRSSRA